MDRVEYNSRNNRASNFKMRQARSVWGVITSKIRVGINYIMLFAAAVFKISTLVVSMVFAKTSLLFCCFCLRLFVTNYVCVVPYGVLRNIDAIIRVSNYVCLKGPVLAIMLRAPQLLFWFSWERGINCFRVLFWWQTKASEFSTSQKWPPRDRSVQCLMGNTGSLIRVFRELDRYSLGRVIN